MDDQQEQVEESPDIEVKRSVLVRRLLYPGVYIWYVILASCDISLTWIILSLGGREENALANWIFEHGGLVGAVIFKFATVVIVVVICEFVGRHRNKTGRRVAEWAIENMQAPEGYFCYQKRRFWTKKYMLMRWCNAWMAYGLSSLMMAEHKLAQLYGNPPRHPIEMS